MKELFRFTCYGCGEEITAIDWVGADDEQYCQDCFRERWFDCNKCGETFAFSELSVLSQTDESMNGTYWCKKCAGEIGDNNGGLRDETD